MTSTTANQSSRKLLIWFCDASYEVEVEEGVTSLDIDVLKYQFISLLLTSSSSHSSVSSNVDVDVDDLFFVDYCGRPVNNGDDLLLSDLQGNDNNLLWCETKSRCDYQTSCSLFCGKEDILQPTYFFVDTDILLCSFCARKYFDASVIRVNRSHFAPFSCQIEKAREFGLTNATSIQQVQPSIPNMIQLYLQRQWYKQWLLHLPNNSNTNKTPEMVDFERRIQNGVQTILSYENKALQEQARAVIDFQKLKQHVDEQLQTNPTMAKDVAFMHGLLKWFKCDFFTWCNKPKCANVSCANTKGMESVGAERSSWLESQEGGAGHTEIYRCNECHQITRFPRYNKPEKLLCTRTGRCGEFANTFCLVCRSLGLDARYVLDWTDHVWVEVWLPSLQRYVHADSCERALDTSLMYEAGWNKALLQMVSFSRFGVSDSTARYTRKLSLLLAKRNSAELSEVFRQQCISQYNQQLEQKYSQQQQQQQQQQDQQHFQDLATGDEYYDALTVGVTGFAALCEQMLPTTVAQQRKRRDEREILGMSFLPPGEVKLEELRGRISGDLQWKQQRGEEGKSVL